VWRATARTQGSGKQLPLLLEHSTTVVGHIDPQTMRANDEGLTVAGEVDRSSDEGQRVWRAIKSGVMGFSIGFMSGSQPRADGGREIHEIDLLEVSATIKPVHPATRTLSWKSGAPLVLLTAADLTTDATRAKSLAEYQADFEMATKNIDLRPPIRIASFEC
jgi:HK97 family phage prohead protease